MSLTPENTFLIGLLAFWAIIYTIGLFLKADKHGFKILPFFLTYRSERFRNTIQKIGDKDRLLWKTLGNVSIAFGLGLTVYVTYFLSSNLAKFFLPTVESVPIVPIVPAVTIRLDSLPYFFAAVTIIVITHELAHGVSATSEKIPVKSAGLAFVLAFFGGFVEPEQKSFEKGSKASKLRIVSAGSAVNLAMGLLVFLLLTSLFLPSAGVLVDGTVENGPLARAGVKRFDLITAINNTQIASLQDLSDYLQNVSVGDLLVLVINGVSVAVTTQNVSGRAIIGLASGLNYRPFRFGLDHVVSANVYLTLYWTFVAAFSVAVFNMLPAFPFDGEKFVYHYLEDHVAEGKRLRLRVLINIVFLGLLLSNMILSLWFFGLLSV